MTQDDCNNSRSEIKIQLENFESVSPTEKIEFDQIGIKGTIEKTLWDAALASADAALVLVQWLESKRS